MDQVKDNYHLFHPATSIKIKEIESFFEENQKKIPWLY